MFYSGILSSTYKTSGSSALSSGNILSIVSMKVLSEIFNLDTTSFAPNFSASSSVIAVLKPVKAKIGVFLSISITIILLREQLLIDDKQWLRRMISHHSTALTTSHKIYNKTNKMNYNLRGGKRTKK